MNENNTLKRILIGLAILAFIVAAWMIEDRLSAPAPESTADEEVQAEAKDSMLHANGQAAGSSVTVETRDMPDADVWVAVQEMRSGELSNVLGAAKVLPSQAWVTVPLLRNTVPGATYAVVLYRDDGDRAFDFHKDSIYVDFDSGERVVSLFKTL